MRRGVRALVTVALFSSGAGSLMLETLWFRQARLAFGSTVWASAVVTAAFMFGLAVGGALATRVRGRGRGALLSYARLELLVAIVGPALALALPSLAGLFAPFDHAHADKPWLVHGVRITAALVLLLLPCVALGMGLPLLTHGTLGRRELSARGLSWLYGANTLGAALGALSVELLLVELVGVRMSALAAGGMNALAAALVFGVAARFPRGRARAAQPVQRAWFSRRAVLALAAAALVGFALLALEQLWLRLLSLFLLDTPLLFALVLALVLTFVAAGSFSAGRLLARAPDVARYGHWLLFASGAWITASLALFPRVLSAFFRVEESASALLLISLPLIAPIALASGAIFPLLVARTSEGGRVLGAELVTFANAFGGGLGALLCAAWLLPGLGLERCLFLIAILFGCAGLSLVWSSAERQPLQYAAAAALFASLFLFPFGLVEKTLVHGTVGRWMGSEDRVVAVRDGLSATLVQVRHRKAGLDLFDQLATNAYSMSSNDYAARRYMGLFAELPLALHPGMKRALVIGYGVGNTTAALARAAEFARIDVVDTSPETLEIGRGLGGDSPLSDARVATRIEDGRHFLAGSSEGYDLITGEPPPPLLAGVELLYTREFFTLMHARLNEGGFASYWLPLINISAPAACSVVSAFCAAFADCTLWHGAGPNFMLLGSRGAHGAVDIRRFAAQWSRDGEGPLPTVGLEHPAQLAGLFIGDAPYLADVCREPALSDDRPRQMQAPGTRAELAGLIERWRDTAAARQRFEQSAWIAELWPARARRAASSFEHQRLINDLLWGNANARVLPVLDQVLQQTSWKFPVLLMLGSDPDVQRALSDEREAAHESAPWRRDRMAGALAARDFVRAWSYAQGLGPDAMPMAGLYDYLRAHAEPQLTQTQN